MFYGGSDVSSIAVGEELLHDFIAMDDRKVKGNFSVTELLVGFENFHERRGCLHVCRTERKNSVKF